MQNSVTYRITKSRTLHIVICVLSALTAVPLLAIIGKVVAAGWHGISWAFLTESTPSSVEALVANQMGRSIPGGIANGIVGSLLMLLMACAIAVPLGICCGVFLSEKRGTWFAKTVSYLTDMLQGTPSIIIGIVVYMWVVIPTKGYSAIAGATALLIMMLPLIVRSTEETLSMLPAALKEASVALGGSYARVLMKVMLPSAFGGIFKGVLLAVSRVIGESAPLMFTALGCYAISWDVTHPVSAVPLLIWQFFNDPNLQPLIWSASLLLLFFVLFINLTSKAVAKKWSIN